MAVSGKTAAPHEIPYFLDGDAPPNMATVTKAMADRLQLRLNAIDPGQVVAPGGAGDAGKLLIVGATGATAAKAMSGDGTIDKDGVLTLTSPNNAVYKLIHQSQGLLAAQEIGTYMMGSSALGAGGALTAKAGVALTAANAVRMPEFIAWGAAGAVAGKTAKFLLECTVHANNVATGGYNLKFGVYPVTMQNPGGAGTIQFNLGTKLTLTAPATPEVKEPAGANGQVSSSGDTNIPAEGKHVVGVEISGANMGAGAVAAITTRVFVRHV